mgnify:CR=1 FL=1
MKVTNRIEWSHAYTCKGCKSEVVAEASDVRFGRFGSFDEYEDTFYVDCCVCGERLRWTYPKANDIPPNVQRDAREKYNKENPR